MNDRDSRRTVIAAIVAVVVSILASQIFAKQPAQGWPHAGDPGGAWIRVCVGKGASVDFAEVVPCGPRTQDFDFLLGNDGTVHWKRKSFEWEVGK